MSEFITTDVTPKVRSVTDETSLSIVSNPSKSDLTEKNLMSSEKASRDRRSSSSSFTSTSSSTDSITTFAINQNKDDDDVSSNEDTTIELENLQQRLHTLRRLCKFI